MSQPSHWFAGEPVRNESEARYLTRLRQLPAKWDIDNLRAEHTSSFPGLDPLCVDLHVPGLHIPFSVLQVAYWSDREGGPVMHGAWGDDYLLEDHDSNDPQDLTITGVHAEPEQFASWAADWMLRQLRRPVVEERWLRRETVVARTWRFGDTGRVLSKKGLSARRLFRHRADHTAVLRDEPHPTPPVG